MNILFLCVANSARSQMAEGLARHLYPEHRFQSAGSMATRVHPLAVEALAELGIDISFHTSKAVADMDLSKVDYIIRLCAEEVCPPLPAGSSIESLSWPTPDPAGDGIEAFRTARDQIKERLEKITF